MHPLDADKTTFITPQVLFFYDVMPFGLKNVEVVTKDLDMTDELHEAVAVRIASYQQRLINHYNKCVKPHAFRAGDLVLRRVFENTADLVPRNLQPNWGGHT